ncbi:hypothetical protein MANY_53730 [Mycolicibacterium anyangense]|uniref:Uncharacterized protein n=1 Tax=Mycolicibacterium anyangense TaxID=1431246 RepID=A0A6N4WDD2_9MYCO|nr:hypothetical protein [Mycolicibacterium anyangense]BBZ80036.1 hypothetical protein MANY_53730 [Mycolicibacterium anyangense]
MLDVSQHDAVEQLLLTGTRVQRRHVERIDCCDSEIHRHLFSINSDPNDHDGERESLRELTADDAAIVDSEFDVHLAMMLQDWQERVRRWLDD